MIRPGDADAGAVSALNLPRALSKDVCRKNAGSSEGSNDAV